MKCWHKSPLGPTIMNGCYVLAYIDSENEFKTLQETFKAKVVKVEEVLALDPEALDVGKDYALVWCWS